MNYRGIIPGHAINTALAGVRKRFDVEFVDWSPTGNGFDYLMLSNVFEKKKIFIVVIITNVF